MAAVDFPYNLCRVAIAGYALDEYENVRRTSFESGAIDQKRIASRVMRTRDFDVLVKVSDVVAFRRWMDTNGADFFNFRDWEETDYSTDPPTPAAMRDCRIVGGRVALDYVDGQRLDGERYLSGRMTIEGLPT